MSTGVSVMTTEIFHWGKATARTRRGRLVAALALAVGLAGPTTGLLSPTASIAQEQGDAEVVLDGKGWGHGVGMAQDGALAMGAAGSSTEEILEAFYPGTSLGEAGGNVEVSVASQPAVEIAFPSGGQLVDALSGAPSPGFPVTVSPGGSVAVSIDGGRYRVAPLAGAVPEPLPPPPPVTTVPDTPEAPPAPAPDPELTTSGPLSAVPAEDTTTEVGGAGRYRGVLRLEGGDGGLEVVNQVDVEDYLRGWARYATRVGRRLRWAPRPLPPVPTPCEPSGPGAPFAPTTGARSTWG